MPIGARSALSIERIQISMREQMEIGGVQRESIPEVSSDFRYTRARDSETKSARAVCCLVAIDSQTGYIHWAIRRQEPFSSHRINFSQLLGYPGYSAITYRSDSEPTTRQILKMLINSMLDTVQDLLQD